MGKPPENVIYPGFITKLDIPAERILQKALDKGMESVVIAGHDKEGNEYFASSVADGGACLWLIERLKKRLLQVPEDLCD